MLYSGEVLMCFRDPARARDGEPSCGDLFAMFIRAQDGGLVDIGYRMYRFPAAIADYRMRHGRARAQRPRARAGERYQGMEVRGNATR